MTSAKPALLSRDALKVDPKRYKIEGSRVLFQHNWTVPKQNFSIGRVEGGTMNFVFEHIWARVFLAVLLLGLVSTGAWAQASAQISGSVTDQTAARLPGVEVTLTQTATGLVRTAVTDETGSYVITNLPVGPYRLE